MLIFRSADLYHFVEPWTTRPMECSDRVTPGRVSCVFFTPKDTADELEGRNPQWFSHTGGGLFDQGMGSTKV